MRVLARAAGPEGPERLPALRPSTPGRRALKLLLAALLVLAFAASGCGGDEEPSAETAPALPNLTVPQGETAPETQPEEVPEAPFDPSTETLPPETVPPATGGGTPAPEAEPPADTPENNTPPPPDSPAERFEEFCDDNPGACG
jgi:type IV secretory pathway VirB10-like protein